MRFTKMSRFRKSHVLPEWGYYESYKYKWKCKSCGTHNLVWAGDYLRRCKNCQTRFNPNIQVGDITPGEC